MYVHRLISLALLAWLIGQLSFTVGVQESHSEYELGWWVEVAKVVAHEPENVQN